MAGSILSMIASSFLGKVAFSAKDEKTGNAVWTTIKIKDVEIDSSSANSSNPIYSGASADQSTVTSLLSSDIQTLKIIQPSKLKIICFCNNNSAVMEIISSFLDTQSTLTIKTKGITANNMSVIDVEIEQNPDMISATRVIIDLEQTLPPTAASTFNPAQSSDAAPYGVSIQTPASAAISPTDLFNKISSAF
jgi:hypothetical protein